MSKKRIPPEVIDAAVTLAQQTSITNAARAHNIAPRTILLAFRARGIVSRRPGNYTLAEHDRVAPRLVP